MRVLFIYVFFHFLLFIFCRSPDVNQRIDLSLLRPLWDLYVGLCKNTSNKSSHLPPPVERALTELFLHAENLAVVSIFVYLLSESRVEYCNVYIWQICSHFD